ncbi:MAG: hypothetical protein IJK30_11210 [Ruminococcus sp.]|nr:hypothetical protein [Ruminococcus sp.]
MNYDYYKTLIGEYINLGRSKERLLGEIGFPEELKLPADGLTKAIDIIAAAAENSMKELVELSGLSMRAFAGKYMIPYRSMQNWCAEGKEARTPPDYLALLIGYELITELKVEGLDDVNI